MDLNFEIRQNSLLAVRPWATSFISQNLFFRLWNGVIHFLQGCCENVETCTTHCMCPMLVPFPYWLGVATTLESSCQYLTRIQKVNSLMNSLIFGYNGSATRAWIIVLLLWTSFGTGPHPRKWIPMSSQVFLIWEHFQHKFVKRNLMVRNQITAIEYCIWRLRFPINPRTLIYQVLSKTITPFPFTVHDDRRI